MPSAYFSWNPSLVRCDLCMTRLTRPCVIWLYIKTLISSASSLSLALSTPGTVSFLLFIDDTMHALCLQCSSPGSHMTCSLTPFSFLPKCHPTKGFSMTLLKLSCVQFPMPLLSFTSLKYFINKNAIYFTYSFLFIVSLTRMSAPQRQRFLFVPFPAMLYTQ